MLNKVWLLFKIWNRPHLYNQFWSAPKWNKLSLTSWLNLIFPLLILLIHLSFLWTGEELSKQRILCKYSFCSEADTIILFSINMISQMIKEESKNPSKNSTIDGQKNPVLLFSQEVSHDKIMRVIGKINQNLDRFIWAVFSVVNFPHLFNGPLWHQGRVVCCFYITPPSKYVYLLPVKFIDT